MIDCRLKQIHRVKHSVPIRINTQTHRCDELVYFISGNGTTMINEKVHTYSAGSFAFYKMGTPHDEYDPEPCDIIWLHFSFCIDDVELKEGVFYDRDGKLLSALQKLRNLSLAPKTHNSQMTEIYLAEVIITASEHQQEPDISNDNIKWKEILNYIDVNLNEQIDFKVLAANNHYSYDRFRHLFSECFGLSPYAYLTRQRIEGAKKLLKTSSSSITDIALDCGFNSSSQFTNIFKKHTGLTPKEYRQYKT